MRRGVNGSAVQRGLEEMWRVGGDDGDLIFGLITQVRQDHNGDLYVMDAQLSRVHVLSTSGDHLRTIFAEGDGPGEIRGIRQDGFCQAFSAFTDGRAVIVSGFVQKPGREAGHLQQSSFLAAFDDEGRRVVDFAHRENDISFAGFTFEEDRHLASFWWNTAVADDGRVFVATDLHRYRIEVRQADGRLDRIISREHQPWPRTHADKERFTEIVQAVYHGAPMEVQVDCNDHEPWDGRHDSVFFLADGHAVVVTGYADAMLTQFTGGHLGLDLADGAESVELIYCRVR